MNLGTNSSKITISLPKEARAFFEEMADRSGLKVNAYIRVLLCEIAKVPARRERKAK